MQACVCVLSPNSQGSKHMSHIQSQQVAFLCLSALLAEVLQGSSSL